MSPITNTEVVDAYRANALFDAHRDDPEFGHRLLSDEARDVGELMADRTAWSDRWAESDPGHREELRIAIVIWLERTYHRCRPQPRLGRLTPIEFETIMNTPAALAA